MIEKLIISTAHQGLHEITERIESIVRKSQVQEGMCHLFIQHTSASLIIQENADPTAKRDLENWMNKLVEEHNRLFTHTLEGPDDMPSHIKSVLTSTSLSIPIIDQHVALGTWQGIYVWEHRKQPHQRCIIVHISRS